ncbi:MAG TPA: YdcH family protein [Magnetospirillaceae bacterium]|nr:YdcH family protein [Magnetospirillaceae bacterium]
MSLHDRVESLKDKHAALDAALTAETRRPQLSPTAVSEMKRKKLRIKDELERLTASL